ncbi:sugar ABC transporter permease [Nocardioides terrisoli]|uniref:sugar ABC transporter permease n=1 Tax=Nocardioides terrisoli TaxID=3388267 RepID=UPI00287BC627|nr:sugar ABC transporter permease [Nocardioides marmorisolisilvae]
MSAPQPTVALDQLDERLRQGAGLRGAADTFWRSVRAGDVGPLPVIVGLLVIGTIFQVLNSVFLSSGNLVNLTLDSCAVGVIALGIVCVLLVGEIDLSVGSVSGFSAAVVAVLFVRNDWNWVLAVVVACLVACGIGLLYGVLLTRFGMPSFVSSLAGLLAFLGLQLAILGGQGSVNLPFDSWLVSFAQLDFVAPWLSYVLAALASLALFLSGFDTYARRRRANLSTTPLQLLVARSVLLLVVAELVVWYLNQSRGVGWMVVFFVALVLAVHYGITRTSWGRSLLAVGGNVEAARRAGINVNRVYISAFVLCSLFAGIGGILAAGRLASANLSSGTGDVNLNAIAAAVIGGTSLFGGRGTAFSALLGILVIESISNGLTLLNLDSSYRFVITGLVLAIAVAIDSLARKSRASHGRA